MCSEEGKSDKFLSGFTHAEPFQHVADIRRGDPQFAALSQYFATKVSSGAKHCVLDFGAGGGVTAYVISTIWETADPVPQYVAVDLDEPLNNLSIPTRVHNDSQKIPLHEFYKNWLPEHGSRVTIFVVRNVLHEMNISDTAQLLHALLRFTSDSAEIYVQDMESLPRAERNRVGWPVELISDVLEQSGFSVQKLKQTSFSGTAWFSLIARVKVRSATVDNVLEICIKARGKQKDLLVGEIGNPNLDGAIHIRHVADLAALTYQLSTVAAPETKAVYPLKELGVQTLSLEKFGPGDFANPAGDDLRDASGLVAVLSRKGIIDFDAELQRSEHKAHFCGVSLRSFFQDPKSFGLCERLLTETKGTVKLLMSDPSADFAALRSREPVYGPNSDTFLLELNESLKDAKDFYAALVKKHGEDATKSFDVRITPQIMYSSYVLTDRMAFVSAYSSYASGSTGFCYVFEANSKSLNSGYRILETEFDGTWQKSRSLIKNGA